MTQEPFQAPRAGDSAVQAELRALREDVARLQAIIEPLRAAFDDPMFRSFLETRRIPYGTTYVSPVDSSKRYVLRRAAGGGASFVAAPAATSSWSDA